MEGGGGWGGYPTANHNPDAGSHDYKGETTDLEDLEGRGSFNV